MWVKPFKPWELKKTHISCLFYYFGENNIYSFTLGVTCRNQGEREREIRFHLHQTSSLGAITQPFHCNSFPNDDFLMIIKKWHHFHFFHHLNKSLPVPHVFTLYSPSLPSFLSLSGTQKLSHFHPSHL